ncbi:TNR [Symbiodinium sp. CCMP2592]|nr:TNR [Symbiodinium sp. CCMP2592]
MSPQNRLASTIALVTVMRYLMSELSMTMNVAEAVARTREGTQETEELEDEDGDGTNLMQKSLAETVSGSSLQRWTRALIRLQKELSGQAKGVRRTHVRRLQQGLLGCADPQGEWNLQLSALLVAMGHETEGVEGESAMDTTWLSQWYGELGVLLQGFGLPIQVDSQPQDGSQPAVPPAQTLTAFPTLDELLEDEREATRLKEEQNREQEDRELQEQEYAMLQAQELEHLRAQASAAQLADDLAMQEALQRPPKRRCVMSVEMASGSQDRARILHTLEVEVPADGEAIQVTIKAAMRADPEDVETVGVPTPVLPEPGLRSEPRDPAAGQRPFTETLSDLDFAAYEGVYKLWSTGQQSSEEISNTYGPEMLELLQSQQAVAAMEDEETSGGIGPTPGEQQGQVPLPPTSPAMAIGEPMVRFPLFEVVFGQWKAGYRSSAAIAEGFGITWLRLFELWRRWGLESIEPLLPSVLDMEVDPDPSRSPPRITAHDNLPLPLRVPVTVVLVTFMSWCRQEVTEEAVLERQGPGWLALFRELKTRGLREARQVLGEEVTWDVTEEFLASQAEDLHLWGGIANPAETIVDPSQGAMTYTDMKEAVIYTDMKKMTETRTVGKVKLNGPSPSSLGQNAAFYTALESDIGVVMSHPIFSDTADCDPWPIKDGAGSNSGVQIIFQLDEMKIALEQRGAYKAAGNLAWIDPLFAPIPGVPIRRSSVELLRSYYFDQDPQLFLRELVVFVTSTQADPRFNGSAGCVTLEENISHIEAHSKIVLIGGQFCPAERLALQAVELLGLAPNAAAVNPINQGHLDTFKSQWSDTMAVFQLYSVAAAGGTWVPNFRVSDTLDQAAYNARVGANSAVFQTVANGLVQYLNNTPAAAGDFAAQAHFLALNVVRAHHHRCFSDGHNGFTAVVFSAAVVQVPALTFLEEVRVAEYAEASTETPELNLGNDVRPVYNVSLPFAISGLGEKKFDNRNEKVTGFVEVLSPKAWPAVTTILVQAFSVADSTIFTGYELQVVRASTTTTTTLPPDIIVGEIAVTVSDCANLSASSAARDDLAGGIALAAAVSASQVEVFDVRCSARRLANEDERRLSGSAVVDYAIVLPAGSVDPSTVVASINSETTASMTSKLQAALDGGSSGLSLAVTSFSSPAINPTTTSSTTATATSSITSTTKTMTTTETSTTFTYEGTSTTRTSTTLTTITVTATSVTSTSVTTTSLTATSSTATTRTVTLTTTVSTTGSSTTSYIGTSTTSSATSITVSQTSTTSITVSQTSTTSITVSQTSSTSITTSSQTSTVTTSTSTSATVTSSTVTQTSSTSTTGTATSTSTTSMTATSTSMTTTLTSVTSTTSTQTVTTQTLTSTSGATTTTWTETSTSATLTSTTATSSTSATVTTTSETVTTSPTTTTSSTTTSSTTATATTVTTSRTSSTTATVTTVTATTSMTSTTTETATATSLTTTSATSTTSTTTSTSGTDTSTTSTTITRTSVTVSSTTTSSFTITSTTTMTSTTLENYNIIAGSLTLEVSDCPALDTTQGRAGLAEGIAETANVSAEFVAVTVACNRRLEALMEAFRRLSTAADVDYLIDLPYETPKEVGLSASRNLESETVQTFTVRLETAVARAGVPNLSLNVTVVAPPSVDAKTTTTTTTLYCPGEPPCGGANYGTCVMAPPGYTPGDQYRWWICNCEETYNGSACDERVCPVCQNNGTCASGEQNLTAEWTCDCPITHQGERCEYLRCPGDCNNAGDCDKFTGVCACFDGYDGADCGLAPGQLVPITNAIELSLTWGLLGYEVDNKSEPDYDYNFDLFDPEVQEWIFDTCSAARADPELLVREEVVCWIEGWKTWVMAVGGPFPVNNSDLASEALQVFMHQRVASSFLGDVATDGVDYAGRPYFTRVRLKINVAANDDAEYREEVRQKWDTWVENRNAIAPAKIKSNTAQRASALVSSRTKKACRWSRIL